LQDLIKNEDIATTSITCHEILTGLKIKKAKKEEKIARRFFSNIRILKFDKEAAEFSSEIAARLLAVGKAVNSMDVIIAGIALANGAEKIVTRDKDFVEISKVSDLEVLVYD